MTSSELQRQVKAALELLNVPVTKDYSEFLNVYPHIVYREVSNVPACHGDNRELAFHVVYQVAIVTNNDDYETLESNVESSMLRLGFVRIDTQDIFDGSFNRVIRFSITKTK